MSKKQAHIDQLFRRYLSGDIGPGEEAELEAYAQEEEALARAIQAIREQPMLDHPAAVERIKSRLPRAARKKTLLTYRWVAAACLLLAVGTSLLWLPEWSGNQLDDFAMRPTESQAAEKAIQEAAAEDAPDPVTPAALPKVRAKKAPSLPTAEEKIEKQAKQAPATPSEEQLLTTKELGAPGEETKQQLAANTAVAPTEEQAEIAVRQVPAAAATKRRELSPPPIPATTMPAQDRLSADFTQAVKLPSVAGYITNEEGEPIAEVEVLLAGQPMGIRTDSSGFFVLKGIQAVERISFSHPNYRSFTLALGGNQRELQIALEAVKEEPNTDWMLEAARTTIYPNPIRSFAYPQQGMKALKKAIVQQIPPELRQGKIRISFTVDKLGKVSNISADENTPAALLENIGNYLRQNSRWQLVSDENEPVEVSMLLRL